MGRRTMFWLRASTHAELTPSFPLSLSQTAGAGAGVAGAMVGEAADAGAGATGGGAAAAAAAGAAGTGGVVGAVGAGAA